MLVITGPTGNVGTELTRALADQGDAAPAYRVANRDVDRIHREFGEHVPTVFMDYDDRSTWGPALDGVTTLFLLYPVPKPKTVKTWMKPFVDAAVAAGVQHIVYVTVPGADHLKFVPHYQVERHIESTGTAHTFLRCSYFSQNLVRNISTHGIDIVEHDEIFIPGGTGKTTFIDSRDVAEVIIDIVHDPAPHKDKTYLLTGPQRLDFYECADILTEVLGRKITYAKPSMPAFWRRLKKRGVTWDTIAFMTIVYTLTRFDKNDPQGSDLPELLGREATPFRTFAEDYRWRWETSTWT
jgi:uncharacterized protein YbjT (DUF2867 family)